MSPRAQQVVYVLALLGLLAALMVGTLAGPQAGTDAHPAGVCGSSRDS
ncbi:hypothetical protein OEB94_14170 [Streptomyces sp. ICN988]|nr:MULTISPECIES: hypothetical protein [Streptomyces]MCV2460423.1 hypothetical protein [Streptomyces sp. ICN988]